MKPVTVVPHDPIWFEKYAAEAEQVAQALGPNVVRIHHIGSTSIPGIYAKPVIDILVEVRELAKVDSCGRSMEALGYQVMGEFGIEGRRYFRKDSRSVRTHQVHVFETASPQVARHLAFRDYLIAHPEVAKAYSDLKRKLSQIHPDDMDAYMDGKDPFIKEIDARAGG